MENKNKYQGKQNHFNLINNNVNQINCNNISKMKMNTDRNKFYLRNALFNKNNKEESKNKHVINENNHQKNILSNNVRQQHNKNFTPINGNELFSLKYKKGAFNNQFAEEKKPITYRKKNGYLPNKINNNINKNQNFINNQFSTIDENETQHNNGQYNYQISNINLQKMKNNTAQNQIFSFHNFKEPPLIVLKCVGNTTYINTVLQCLANIRNITSYFLKNMSIINLYKEQMPITFAYCKVALNLFPNPNKQKKYIYKYDPKEFYDCIFANNSVFRGKSTKNAIDFLVYLINKMHDEDLLNPINNNNINQNQLIKLNNENFNNYIKYLQTHENSIILNTFSYISQNTKKCWNCNHQNITFQKFFTYDLNLDLSLNKTAFEHKNELSIYDCINFTSQEESIFNIYCNICKTKNNFSKKFSIHLSQSVLIFLLRGMEKKEIIENMKNDNIKIKVDKDLDLSDLIELKDKDHLKYTFHGMILYDSENKEYLAYSISPINAKLYKYIKEKIIPIEQNEFINLYDYKLYPVILFYRHLNN